MLMGFWFCLEEERKFGGRNPEGNRNEDNETEELTFILLPPNQPDRQVLSLCKSFRASS